MVILFFILCLGANSQNEDSDTMEIGIKGGSLGVQNEKFYVTVSIPEGALLENKTLTLSVNQGIKWGPFAKNVITGISLKPEGLFFMDKIEITACSYNHDVTIHDAIFWLKNNNLAIPCGNQRFSTDEGTVTGNTYISGNFILATPSEKEILQEAQRMMSYYPVSEVRKPVTAQQQKKGPNTDLDRSYESDCIRWQEVNTVLDGVVKYIDLAQAFGNFKEDEKWQNYGKQYLQEAIDDFLAKPFPDNPCGNFMWATNHYIQAEELWGLNINMDKSPLMERYEAVVDQCSYQFSLETREWINRKERRDDGGTVDEKLNRYGIYKFHIPWMEFINSGKTDVKGQGSETIQYEKKTTVANKERNNTISGTRKVTDIKGGVSASYNEYGEADIQVDIILIFKNDIKSRSWGKGYGSTGNYDSFSENTSESKEDKRFPLMNFEKKYGDESFGSSIRVVILNKPDWRDRSRECW